MMVAIVVSLVAVGAVLGAYAILTREIAVNYRGTHPADATLELEGGVDLPLLKRVRGRPEIGVAEAREVVLARARVGEDWRPLLLFVVNDFAQMRLNTFRSVGGAWPPPLGSLLIERSALAVIGAADAEGVVVKTPSGEPQSLKVSGIVHDPGLAPAWQERQAYGYITPDTLALLGEQPILHELRVGLRDNTLDMRAVEARAAHLAGWLDDQGYRVHQIRVPPPGQHPHQRQMTTLLVLMLVFALMALVLSAILVATSLAAMLARQVREIGVMKTIGAQTRQIASLYRALIGALGIACVLLALPGGIACARVLSRLVAHLLNFDLTSIAIPWWVYATEAMAGVAVPVLIATIPIRRASRITVREAIDEHGVSADTLHSRMSALPYGLRNAMRRPARLALTLGLLAAGGAMFMTALNVSRGWERNLAKITQTRFYDVEVRLHQPVSIALADELRRVPGVREVEPWGWAPAAFGRPGQTDVVRTYPDRGHGSLSMMAPPPATHLVRFPLRSGRWLATDDTDAVVLNHTALFQLPGAQVGSDVNISLDGQPTRWRVVGVVEEIGSPGTVYVRDRAFAQVTESAGQARMFRIVTSAGTTQERTEIARAIDRSLSKSGAGVDIVIPLDELRLAIGGHVQLLIQLLVAMAIIMAIVGMLGLGSTMSISVVERTREIGVMSAIGATPRRIVKMIVTEALFIAGLSWVLAVALALPTTAGLDALVGMLGFLAPLPFVVAINPILLWLALLGVIGLISTLLPASRASSITVHEALAHL
jgi:putative ABC transport system permease protein